ncbi:COX15/CtaA family protein [Rufibacter quisquiliarum]|uniref:Cytochrome c oxidase assembly protein subunit 15 n=1 Tax=Rufibacter quisquiliarum TaxID=1549639 RepID=A0A839GPS6_9BACT|nr:COX15/CtaA family protein [Rufibacter quisquiliarum]MBA9078779.1 cytochrome c oxidase assembly protein subunit 15 [Rufibacter quisquiliarum]
MNKTAAPKGVVLWLLTGAFLILLMVIIGGITRLTNSGLSMVEWNVISGTIPPLSEAEWQVVFQKYQQFPEYQKINFSMDLQAFKQIFWWEYLHRLLGRVIGVVFFVPFLLFLGRGYLKGWLLRRVLLILVLGMAQGAMGWLMVKSGLEDNPHVSHFRLAAHLCLALALIGTILWTVADLTAAPSATPKHLPTLRKGSKVVLIAVLGQIILGAFVAGLKAGLYYNTFPLMNGEFFPRLLQETLTWGNFLENGSFVQFLHRWVALVVVVLVLRLWLKSRLAGLPSGTMGLVHLLLALTGVQVALGIVTLLYQVPVALGVLHQLVAVLLFSVALLLVYRFRAAPALQTA